LRAGRRDEDFRPGLPFSQFWTVLETSTNSTENKFVGQVEQMRQSRCFQASQGRLGCISCHDPHRSPADAEKASYYRNRCLECHSDSSCGLPADRREEQGRSDDCVRCHMPRLPGSNIVHVAETNHRIPRLGKELNRPSNHPDSVPDRRLSWVVFHRDGMDKHDQADAQREIGLVICHDGPDGAAWALPLLEASVARQPTDVPALEALGFALGQLGRGDDGLATFQRVLAMEPNREPALTGASFVAAQAGRLESAIDFCQRAILISPFRADYRAELASLHFRNRDWPSAAVACRDALRLNPADLEIRKLLIRCHLRLGETQAAGTEFDTLLAFDPPDREQLLQWFTPTLKSGSH